MPSADTETTRPTTDPSTQAAVQLLLRIIMTAGYSYFHLLILAACRLAEISTAHARGPQSPLAYIMIGPAKFQAKLGKTVEHVPGRTTEMLMAYNWPGTSGSLPTSSSGR